MFGVRLFTSKFIHDKVYFLLKVTTRFGYIMEDYVAVANCCISKVTRYLLFCFSTSIQASQLILLPLWN